MTRKSAVSPDQSRRGSETKRSSEPRFLTLGVIVRPHGLRGELRAKVSLRDLPQMDRVSSLYLGTDATRHEVESFRVANGYLLLKLFQCDDRFGADALRGKEIRIATEDYGPLQDDEYFVHDLLGLDVLDQHGNRLGELAEVIVTGANDVYRVVGDQGEILIPAIKDVIREVDIQRGEISVCLLPGMV